MVAKSCIFLIGIFLNSIGLKNDEKVFYAKDRYIKEFIVLYSDNNSGVSIALFKDHDWYVDSDFTYILNEDTLRIDFVDDKTESVDLLVRRSKLEKISYNKSMYFNKYHKISAKKFYRINNTEYINKRNVL